MTDYIRHSACTDFTIHSTCTSTGQAFRFTMTNPTTSVLYGGTNANDVLNIYANDADSYPYISLNAGDANDHIELHSGFGVTMHRQTHQMLRVASDGSNTSIFGSDDASADDLYIFANDKDAYPFIRMYGTSGIRNYVAAGSYFRLYDSINLMFQFEMSGTQSQMYGGSDAGDDLYLYANSSDALPYIRMDGAGQIQLFTQDQLIFHDSEGQFMLMDYNGVVGEVTIRGANATGEDLKVQANSVDSYSFLQLNGNGEIVLDSYSDIYFREQGEQVFKFELSGTESIIYGSDDLSDVLTIYANTANAYPRIQLTATAPSQAINLQHGTSGACNLYEAADQYGQFYYTAPDFIIEAAQTNSNIYLQPDGTGVVKFGTYAAITTETLQGFITIKDAAGNTRKLGVVA